MKRILLATLFVACPALAADYQGLRLGLGSAMGMQAHGFDTMYPQWRIEAGYDLNRMFSVNAYYQNLSRWETEEQPMPGDHWRAGGEIKGGRIGMELETGWTFNIEDGWGVKPYLALGFADQIGHARAGYEHNQHGPEYRHSLDRNGITAAIGARIMPMNKFGAYIDARIDSAAMDDKIIKHNPHATLTIGFKF